MPTDDELRQLLLKHDARHADGCPQGRQNYWRMRREYRPATYGPDQPCSCGLDAIIGHPDDRSQG